MQQSPLAVSALGFVCLLQARAASRESLDADRSCRAFLGPAQEVAIEIPAKPCTISQMLENGLLDHFHPSHRALLTVPLHRAVRLWRTGDGSLVGTFSEHENGVSHVAFSPDSQTLSSGDGDGTVFIRRMCDVFP